MTGSRFSKGSLHSHFLSHKQIQPPLHNIIIRNISICITTCYYIIAAGSLPFSSRIEISVLPIGELNGKGLKRCSDMLSTHSFPYLCFLADEAERSSS